MFSHYPTPTPCRDEFGCRLARGSGPDELFTCDVSRECSYAPAVRPVYVKIGDGDSEEGDEQRCGRLNVSMYGARDAALN